MQPSVAVVILNWNGKGFLKEYLPSFLKTTYKNHKLYVADNGSSDDSISFMETTYPDINIIKLDKNYGFAGGYNKALDQVNADYLAIVNSDLEVTPTWLEPMVEMLSRDATIAACQPKIKWLRMDTHFEYAGAAGGFIDTLGYPFCRGRLFDILESDNNQYDTEKEIFWATGACFLVKTGIFKSLGGFDEDFFAHMEEIDLCWRIKNEGYKIMYTPMSTIYHLGGGTLNTENPKKTFLNFRNSLIAMQKNLPSNQVFGKIFVRMCLDLAAWFKFALSGKIKHAFAINKAHAQFVFKQGKWIKKRQMTSQKNLNPTGIYKRSIVWDYYVRKKRLFSELNAQDFEGELKGAPGIDGKI
ncbi:MAG: GT2 family glycosyltransferase [Sphingobacteriales bacterium]|jgi:GT2 family glycosyltransferase